MPTYGLTTTERDAIANAWGSNTPLLHPMNAVQLYIGAPGPTGVANVSAIGSRQQVLITNSSGLISITGAPPTWLNLPVGELITGIGLWTDLTAGYCWYTAPLQVAEQTAAGDKYILNTGNIPFVFGLAS